MRVTIIVIIALSTTCLGADDNHQAQEAYCKYVTEQASAQRDFLLYPSAEVGPIQPSTGTPPQLIFGFTGNLINLRRAALTLQVAKTSCELYKSASEAQLRVFYALPSIEKEVLRHRLVLIEQVSEQLDRMIAQDRQVVEAKNMTRPELYSVQEAKLRLDASRIAALTGIVTPFVPALSDTPLRDLISQKQVSEEANQKAQAKLAKQSAWDVTIGVGTHRQLSNPQFTGAYGELSVSYNLGSHAMDKHLDRAAIAYVDWKSAQEDDVVHQAAVLKEECVDTLKLEEEQSKVLLAHDKELTDDIALLKDVDTSAGIAFREKLVADELVLQVDIADVTFREQK